jgi:hypothetical protein
MSSGGSINFDEFEMQEEVQEYVGDMPVSLTFAQFPLETPSGIQAAWTFISDPDNAAEYDQYEVEQFKLRVQQSARQKGVSLR